jgi:predicted transcriptional regulator
LSQKALAGKAGVSQNYISLLEAGKQQLKPALAKKLGRLFKTSITAEN